MLHVKTTEKQIATQDINLLIYNVFNVIDTHIAVDAFLRN
ncbi:hypothetical protein NUITMVP1_23530 [Proteus mirabilis]|nr:hypothetical protein NUITMVP1_23530 [Proteus mirabilis]